MNKISYVIGLVVATIAFSWSSPPLFACDLECKIIKFSQSDAWLSLGHYQSKMTGGFVSRADSKSFFLAENGKNSPLAELRATIAALGSGKPLVGRLKQKPACALPARRRMIVKQLGLDFPEENCEELSTWIRRMRPESMAVVFSSGYANSPGSMFGHTFLKISPGVGSMNSEAARDLLSYGVSFAANMGDVSVLEYAVLGMSGGFEGLFSIAPYYMKIKEYAFTENRDLWEYELNLNAEQVRFMVEHLWELTTAATFDYYFLDENCASIIFNLLDVANPNWHLSQQLGTTVTPADTVRILMNTKNVVKQVKFRGSDKKKFLQIYSSLSADERSDLKDIINSKRELMTSDSVYLADAALLFTSIQKFKKLGLLSESEQKRNEAALQTRAKLKNNYDRQLQPLAKANQPDKGHQQKNFNLSGFRSTQSRGLELSGRVGYHGLIDDPSGYQPFVEIKFIQPFIRYLVDEKEAYVSKFNVVELLSIEPYFSYFPEFSWKFQVHCLNQKIDQGWQKNHCDIIGGGGGSYRLLKPLTLYLLPQAGLGLSSAPLKKIRLEPGILFAALYRPLNSYAIHGKMKRSRAYAFEEKFQAKTSIEIEHAFSLTDRWQLHQHANFVVGKHVELACQEVVSGLSVFY